ncbi:MAG: UDP-glucose 4-epimerase GalE [Patescibacteria group bacterium]|jgi:UDP-glucose 4-epimerase
MVQPILVTGGAGYIGSQTVQALLDAGKSVVVVDNLSAGSRRLVPDGVAFEQADTRDVTEMNRIMKQYHPSAVMHFAAHLAVGESVEKPIEYYDNNVVGVIRLLDAMRQNNVKRFIFSSTCAIFGQPKTVPVSEYLPPNPESPYGQTKLAVEQLLPWAEKAYGIKWTALRYFNAAGAAHNGTLGLIQSNPSQLIPKAITALLADQEVELYGTDWPTPDGTCVRDYIHVEDLASAHILALNRLEKGGESTVYNLGTGTGTSVKQILDAIEKASGKKLKIKMMPRRLGDPAKVWADNTKAVKELGWQPKYTDINDIVKTAWSWHSKLSK